MVNTEQGQRVAKLDLVQLAEEIYRAKADFAATKHRMRKSEKRIIRKSINNLVRQYNGTVGSKIVPEV